MVDDAANNTLLPKVKTNHEKDEILVNLLLSDRSDTERNEQYRTNFSQNKSKSEQAT